MPQSNPKYASSSRPVNRRTATPQQLMDEPVNPVIHERLAARWAKSRLGNPLSEQLRASGHKHVHQKMSSWLIAGAVVAAASGVVLLLAAIQQSWLLAMASIPTLAVGSCLILFIRHSSRESGLADATTAAFFDEASIRAFDKVLAALAPEVTDAVATQLMAIKQQLARIALLAVNSPADEHFTIEDRMYLTELVRRYLPDSLQSYLIVPKERRTTQVFERGATAESLLLDQLKLLGDELDKREIKLTKSKAGKLIEQ